MKIDTHSKVAQFQSGWGKAVVLLAFVLAVAPAAFADTFADERYHLSLRGPTGWIEMDEALLASANAGVSHVTGRGFIAGYGLHDANSLLFPYLLVQYKPYSAMPEAIRPTHQLNERAKLELICSVVSQFGHRGPLPKDIDTPQFIDRFGNAHAQLVRLDDDGRFDFTGKIPHEVGKTPIRYHTHGVMGKEGIALVSIFSNKPIGELNQIINEEMRTLAFDEGYRFAALPAPPATPIDESDREATAGTEPTTGSQGAPTEGTGATDASTQPADSAVGEAQATTTDDAGRSAESTAPQMDPTVLILVVGILIAGFFGIALVVWLLNHQKAQERKARARERRQRALNGQSTAAVNNQPKKTAPTPEQTTARRQRPTKSGGRSGRDRR